MITVQDIQNVDFDNGWRGYNVEQVRQYLDQVAEQIGDDAKKIAELEKENASLKEKLYILAQKIDEYRADEDNLKSALLNAQRMGENVVREAKQKADAIEREAKIRAEGIVSSAAERTREEQLEFERVRAEISQFKASVLDLYRQHIESLSTLPDAETAEEEEPAAEVAPFIPVEPVAPVAVEPVEETAPVEEPAEEVEQQPASASFWDKELTELTENAPKPEEKPAVLNAFQGIRFSD